MKTLAQAVAEYRAEQARIAAEERAAEERTKMNIAEKEKSALEGLLTLFELHYHINLRDLIWAAQYVDYKSTKEREMFHFRFTLKGVKPNEARAELENTSFFDNHEGWLFFDSHAHNRQTLDDLTWRVTINDRYHFERSIVAAVSALMPPDEHELPF